jgi:hypothetical protein
MEGEIAGSEIRCQLVEQKIINLEEELRIPLTPLNCIQLSHRPTTINPSTRQTKQPIYRVFQTFFFVISTLL